MSFDNREESIRRIIDMEDRIAKCQRCLPLSKCVYKPSFGKGELDPEVFMVFESDNKNTKDSKWLINLRNLIKNELNVDNIYHTFLVRCEPKACTARHNLNNLTDGCSTYNKLLNKDNICFLKSNICSGITVKPSNEEIIRCLPFLLEEMEILKPPHIILFGERVIDYVSKSFGVYELDNHSYFQKKNINFYRASSEESFDISEFTQFKTYFQSVL
ncbi:MAG: hypothetical protein PHC92_00355 [Syntrophomonadaceae bacterium]|nr:hypothetical protein [Syntrophomonadaceae bacterium]MDD3022362.1 hypothetical protein [Syntrophomonadaceae bacterium]